MIVAGACDTTAVVTAPSALVITDTPVATDMPMATDTATATLTVTDTPTATDAVTATPTGTCRRSSVSADRGRWLQRRL
jgi:hypothetical protein